MLRGGSSRGRTSHDLLHPAPRRSCPMTMLLIPLATVRFFLVCRLIRHQQ